MHKKTELDKLHTMDLPKRKKASLVRIIAALTVFLVQIVFLIYALYSLNVFALSAYIVFQGISAVTAMRIVSNQSNPSYKIAWIVLILSIPFLGLLFYIMWGRGRNPNNTKRRIAQLSTMTVPLYKRFKDVEESILKEYPSQSRVTKFLLESGFPVYNNTETVYFSEGTSFMKQCWKKSRRQKIHFS